MSGRIDDMAVALVGARTELKQIQIGRAHLNSSTWIL